MSDFVLKYKPEWDELEALVKRARRSPRRLTPEEQARLDLLYRRVTVCLAQVSTRTSDARLLQYLNQLAASAHSIIYLPPRGNVVRGAGEFFANGFPAAVARQWRFHAVSGLLLLAGCFIAFFAALDDPAAAYAVLPASETRVPGATREQLEDVLRHGRGYSTEVKFAFSSFLFSNNLKVGLLALATGILAAVPTVFLMLFNGMMLGAMTAVYHMNGIHAEYWAWILPHGVTELLAIVFFGGVGLMLGDALLRPGFVARPESVRLAGVEAARVCVGCAPMLLFAALVEGYLRQSHLPTGARLLFAAGTALFWLLYFGRGWIRGEAAKSPVT